MCFNRVLRGFAGFLFLFLGAFRLSEDSNALEMTRRAALTRIPGFCSRHLCLFALLI